jgi:hypothetical protein
LHISYYPWVQRYLTDSGYGSSLDDIEELLNCVWITRMWTYQEAVLARTPIVVCGGSYIGWERFSLSIAFLSIVTHSRYCEHWIGLIISRSIVQTRMGEEEICLGNLRDYFKFWSFCRQLELNLPRVMVSILLVSTPLLILYVAAGPTFRRKVEFRTSVLFLMYLPLLLSVGILLHFVAPSRMSTWPGLSLQQDYLSSLTDGELHIRLLETLATRQSTDPRDMSFNLHAVLRYLSETNLDVHAVDYGDSLGTVYYNLTVHLMQQSRGLQHLSFAGHKRGFDAPSWIPDYSHPFRVHGIGTYPIEINEVTAVGAHFWRFHPDDDKVLVVKGLVFDQIETISEFQRTRATYEHTDEKTHVKNLELFLKWGSSFDDGVSSWPGRSLKFGFLQDVLSTASIPPIDPLDIRSYLRLLRRALSNMPKSHRRLGDQTAKLKIMAESLWSRILTGQSPKHTSLLSTHIKVMITFAEINTRVFESADGCTGSCFGIAERGDRLYWISGKGYPLIMRPNDSGVQLISMAYISREGTGLLNDIVAQAIMNNSATLSLDRSLMKDNNGSLLATASRGFKKRRFTSGPGDLWKNYIYLVQQIVSEQTNGRIPHPKDAPWYESDPHHMLEKVLPDVHIN